MNQHHHIHLTHTHAPHHQMIHPNGIPRIDQAGLIPTLHPTPGMYNLHAPINPSSASRNAVSPIQTGPIIQTNGNGGHYFSRNGTHSTSQYSQSQHLGTHVAAAKSTLSPDSTPVHNEDIHEFWKGRIAPLPGFSSRPGLLPTRELKVLKITKPPSRTRRGDKKRRMKLLAPHSQITGQEVGEDSSSDTLIIRPEESETSNHELDKYAEIFVPQYLKDIQTRLHTLQPIPPVNMYPSLRYRQTYLPPQLIDHSNKLDYSPLLEAPPLATDALSHSLTIESYYEHWISILRWELDTTSSEREQITLWKIGIKVVIWDDSEFLLFVPGIRENYPRLDIGDLLQMREVFEQQQTGSGRAFEGRVMATRKREGFVHFYSPTLRQHIQSIVPHALTQEDNIPLLFNISFLVNARPLCTMASAAATLRDVLSTPSSEHEVARKWLFPNPEDLNSGAQAANGKYVDEDQWHDKGLNTEQRSAAAFVALYQSKIPYLISGPPGTGKTRSIVEMVLQILRVQPEGCILLCAPSNPATDTLVQRLRSVLLPKDMLRLNDHNRTFAEVPSNIMPYCHVEDNKFALPPWETLMKRRVVACSCLDASALVMAQCTNMSLTKLEEEIVSNLHPFRHQIHQAQPHWTHLIIDEAAQGSEPELLIPMSVVVTRPATNGIATLLPQLVLCGDINQLGPVVASENARNAELDVSLLERLSERSVYTSHSYKRPSEPPSLQTWSPFIHLVKNYRSHPAILMPPSALFYDDSLEPCAKNGIIQWSGLSNPRLPIKFIGNETKEECIDERASWYNVGEIEQTLAAITSLLSQKQLCKPALRAKDIGVMSPWREQVWKLRERLRKEGLRDVDVGTVEDYQGRESRVVIISCVRSNVRFLDEDHKKGLGLFLSRKRMNVAITRAKELLIVIGNGDVLQRDPYWRSFLQFMLRNQLYIGPHLNLEWDGSYISRLESQLKDALNGDDTEDQGIVMAGGMIRELLKE
ncbi:P-loop containing nucleoside triphosphate hydrolase protein [Crucibulum laeve]|uniref:P-loop containing nucleoside triphosphate hydrolase protein n=1 Tax=Crucibulum laeve TaxID=68775 RepID=A0A5C3LZ47_9AGAR|nr:P-loop containing nucleoside triphosphate hydrolase protein [Crucibulum laeve]